MIYKIKTQKQFINLIKHHQILCILTNGTEVYAWNFNLEDENDNIKEKTILGKSDNTYNSYYIENSGRLLHCHTIKYPILKKFIKTWFPDCWYGSHIKDYDPHDGICLFDEDDPCQVSLCQQYNLRITSMAQPYYKRSLNKRIFTLFTEDNELPFRHPHVHVCVAKKNKKYLGAPLRSSYWAEQYKSIFSIRIKDLESSDDVPLYTESNLIFEDEIEPHCFANMSEKEKTELLGLLNYSKQDIWINYYKNIEHDEKYLEYWKDKYNIYTPYLKEK